MAYCCTNTSASVIWNVFFQVSWNSWEVTLIWFDGGLSYIYISIEAAANYIELPNGTIISHLNDIPLLHGGANSMIYTAYARWFVEHLCGVSKHHGGK